MASISKNDPLALSVVQAVQEGNLDQLKKVLVENPTLATSNIQDEKNVKRSLLHIATDWPGHFPNVADTIRILLAHGTDVNATINGPDTETPLHWAASSNDTDAIDALLDGGANLDAQGAVIAGGDPLEDAIGFQQWKAAELLAARGAKTRLGDEAALGMMKQITKRFDNATKPSRDSIVYSFWNACCAGRQEAAEFLLTKGAEINWVPDWCEETPLDGAIKSGNESLVKWLETQGAKRNAP